MSKSRIPSVAELAEATLDLLRRQSPMASGAMRAALAHPLSLTPDHPEWPRFVNNHAWSLVKLRADGAIRKAAPGLYALDAVGAEVKPDVATIPIVADAPLPAWARVMIGSARRRDEMRWGGGEFSEADLRHLWQQCGGGCAMTGLPFLETQIGTGRARRPYAPSLDRIDPEKPYSRANCRLFCMAVNFALNAFGDDVFLTMAKAAVSFDTTP
jgi:hypothetical protein